MCQRQLQTIYSEYSKFHPNPFTSGGVIAERVNIVQTRHKVFTILREASASSPSNYDRYMITIVVDADGQVLQIMLYEKLQSDDLR